MLMIQQSEKLLPCDVISYLANYCRKQKMKEEEDDDDDDEEGKNNIFKAKNQNT